MELADIQAGSWARAQPAFRARQIYDAVYRQRVTDLSGDLDPPEAVTRTPGRASFRWDCPTIERRYDSTDGTRRYLLKLRRRQDGRDRLDAAKRPSASTICISSQVGCPVDCKFCLTALMGLERNLTAGEIVGQVLRVAADQRLEANVDRLNIVMMGQGEPLLNLPNVIKATRLLTDPEGMAISPRRITLSTSGIIPKIAELGASRCGRSWRFR